MKKRHIDDAQPTTVEEHFKLLMSDTDFISSDITKVSPADLPDWYDSKLFNEAKQFYSRNMLTVGLTGLLGLIGVLTVPPILDVLIYTKQSGSTCLAYKRYLQTLLHVYTFYYSDIEDPDSKWYKSLNVVRSKHAIGHKRAQIAKIGGISQRDMSLTLYAFVAYLHLGRDKMHLKYTTAELDAFNHFWRIIGHLLGIDDRINVCRKNADETAKLCRRINDDFMRKCLRDMTPEIMEMVEYMLNGFWYIDISVDLDAIMVLYYDILGVEYPKKLSWYSWLNMKNRDIQLSIMGVPYFGSILRVYYNYFVRVIYWIQEHYPVLAWIGFGKSQSAIKLY
ncbi:uncharacterized protein [Prorops nasuta]